ncbi:hypothetical protein PG990_009200 [Apiospora arundinis]
MDFNWDLHFDEVRTLYLIDRKPLKEIRKLFEQKYGCTTSLKHWTQQLGRWKLKKNLSEKDWKYISHVAKKRKASHKDSLVFVSGVQISSDRIQTGRRNHGFALARPSYRISPSPEAPSDVVVSVRTPVPTIGFVEQRLPWLRFQSKLSDYFTLHKSTGPTPTHLSRFSTESDVISFDLSPKSTIFGKAMHHFNSIYREITCYMPGQAPDSNNERAYQIAHGQGLDSVHAMMEVLTFLLSNNLLFEKLNSDPESYDRCVISILKSYLKIGSSIKGIFSSQDQTIQVVLDEAFASIIRSGQLDLLKTFAACNVNMKTLSTRQIIWSRAVLFQDILSPIEVALNNGDVRTANFLLSHGAHIDETGINTIRYLSYRDRPLYCIGEEYGKPLIFYESEMPLEARTPLRAALIHRQTGMMKVLLRAGAKLSEDDIIEAIDQDIFDLLQNLLGHRIEITARILISLVQNGCLALLTDIELGTLPWTESHGEGETALGNAIIMDETHLISSLKEKGCLRYDSFALVAAVLSAESSNDRSMIEYMLGLRAIASLSNNHTRSYLELAAFFLAVSSQDIETLEMLKSFGLFECYAACSPGNGHLTFVDIWSLYDGLEEDNPPVSEFFIDQSEDHLGILGARSIFSTVRAAVFDGVNSLLGLAVGIGANRATMQFLLQTLPKACAMDVLVALKNTLPKLCHPFISVDPLLVHDLIDLATDVKDWVPNDHPTVLEAAIEGEFDCVAIRLLEIGVDPKARPRNSKARGNNALETACGRGNLSMVERLLEAGAEVNSPVAHNGSRSALQIAVLLGHFQLATLLLDRGADCNDTGAIERAAYEGRIDMIELLLARGLETNGIYRQPYFRAIKIASERAHYVAERILRDHRLWDEEDRDAFEETCICDANFYRDRYIDFELDDHQRTCPVFQDILGKQRNTMDKIFPPGHGVKQIPVISRLTVARRELWGPSADLMEYHAASEDDVAGE